MGLTDFIRSQFLEIIEWTDDSRDTLSYRFPDDDKEIKRGAQLIVRESGALVAFPAFDEPLGAPLDLAPHSPVIAARTPEALERLRAVPMEVHAR